MEMCENCELQLPTVKMALHKRCCMFNVKKCCVCGEMILIEDESEHLYEHTAECAFCKGVFSVSDINVHEQVCDMKCEECKYCKGVVYVKDKDEHEEQCGAKTQQCERCGVFVVVKEMECHLKWECGVGERKYCDNNYIEYVNKGKKGKRKGKGKGKKNDCKEWGFVDVVGVGVGVSGSVKGNVEFVNEDVNVNEKVKVNVKKEKKSDMNVVVVNTDKDKGKENDIKKKHNNNNNSNSKHNKTQKKHPNKKPIINNYNQYDYDHYDDYDYDDYCNINLNLHNLKYGIPQHTFDDLSLENSQLQEAIRRSIYQQ